MPTERGPRVRMCRGCCCGTIRKLPDVDHSAIAQILENEIGPASDLVTSDCLWACEHSNVVVVNPAPTARRTGARAAWITEVNTLERAHTLAEWVRAGGPGKAELPAELGPLRSSAELTTRR